MLYRHHFSFATAKRLTTSGGQDTSIEYGFIGSVRPKPWPDGRLPVLFYNSILFQTLESVAY